MIVYDNRFNSNEWFIVFLPKRFPRKNAIVYFMCGIFSGFFFDHSLSVQPVSYYDVNDVSKYQFMDFLSHLTYGPISYLFFYLYDCLQLKPSRIPIYVLIWSLLSVGIEWLAVAAGVFHYQLGYELSYSFPIYLIVQACWIALYHRYNKTSENRHSKMP